MTSSSLSAASSRQSLFGSAERAFEAVVRRRLREVEQQGLVALAPRLVTADCHGGERDAVVRELATDDLPALGPSGGDVVQPRETNGGFDRFGAATGEACARHAVGQPALREPLDQRRLRFSRERGHDVGQLLERLRGDLCHFPTAVADVHDNRAAGGIQNALSVRRDQVSALGARDRKRSAPGVWDESRAARRIGVDGHRPTG